MKSFHSKAITFGLALMLFSATAYAQTTAFSYQGHLNNGTTPANGNYEMQFKLFDTLAGGAQVGGTVTNASVAVANGTFATLLDFGSTPFDTGAARYLEIAVRPAGDPNPFTLLSPRQSVSSTPYTIQARNALKLGGVDANQYVTSAGAGNTFIKNDTVQQTANFNISGNGKVNGVLGIGTDVTAGYKLDVNGGVLVRTTGTGGNMQFATPSGETGITISGTNRADVRFDGGTLKMFVGAGTAIPQTGLIVNTLGNVATSGNLGVGTFSPDTRLTLQGGPSWTSNGWTASMNLRNGAAIAWDADAAGRRFGIGQSTGGLYFFRSFSSFGTNASPADYGLMIADNGNIGIGTITPGQKLEVVGTTKTGILQVTGGSDLAENFAFGEDVKPGLVVAIDPNDPGRLALARGEYNRGVAGVISGANNLAAGMILPDLNKDSNSMPVALSGRVWVYADATRNPIRPGDLLTTSANPGHAMKVANHRRAQGAIIGKAMSSLDSGTGLVLVLVTLQ